MLFLLYIPLFLFVILLLVFLFIYLFLMDTPSVRTFYRTICRDMRGAVLYLKINVFIIISYLRNFTVIDYFNKNVERFPNKVCFLYEDEEWTYKQMDDLSNKIAHCFLKQGFERGDKVALLMENCPDYVCVWLGLAKIGVVTALINTNQKTEILAHSINIIDTKALIFGKNFSEVVEKTMPYMRKKDNLYCYERKMETEQSLPSFCKSLNDYLENTAPVDPRKFKTNYQDECMYIYTSGTTGLPKAAIFKHSRCIYAIAGTKYSLQADGFQTFYNCLPLYHSSGGLMCLGIILVFGGKMVLRRKFSASNFWKDAVKYKVTVCQYIGEICRYLLNQPRIPEEAEHSVQIMFGNGLRQHIWKEFQERFKIKKIIEFYGLTEGNTNIMNFLGKVGSCGFISRIFFRLHAVYLIKVNPETGEVLRDSNGLCIRCNPGETGEVVGKITRYSPTLAFDGYISAEDNTKKIIRDCFRRGDKAFSSGDIMVMDEDGYLYFKDRTGDTFRWKGENVSTSEVENVISKAMDHASCIVFGVEIPNTEGRAGMTVIQADLKDVDLRKFQAIITERLPPYAVPLFIRISSNLEVTGTHKLRKTRFKEEGYNPDEVCDPLYLLDFYKKAYVPLTKEMYSDIICGKIKL